MAIDPRTGLDSGVKTHNPTLKNEASKTTSLPPRDIGLNYKSNLPFDTGNQGISESQYNDNISRYDVNRDRLEELRAKNQPWHHELGNSLAGIAGTFVGETASSIGSINELANGNYMALNSENFLMELGESITKSSNEAFPIYQQNQDGFMLTDREAFFKNLVSLGSTLSLMIPSMGFAKGVSWLGKAASRSKSAILLNELGVAGKLTKQQQWLSEGIMGATFSRQLENVMESGQIYDSLIEQGYSEQDALKAAEEVYNKNWVMLLQDIPQYLALGRVFNPITGKYMSGASKSLGSKALGLSGVVGGEMMEEAYQYVVGEDAKYNIDYANGTADLKLLSERLGDYSDESEFWNAAIMGGIGGGVFQGIGNAINKRGESKRTEKYLETMGIIKGKVFKDIAKADASDNKENSKYARRMANLQLVTNALNHDKYDTHMEYLNGLLNASPEELAAFQEEVGVEMSPEMINEVVGGLIKESESVKNKYLKYTNKYGSEIASEMAFNDVQIDYFTDKKNTINKSKDELKSKIPNFDELTGFAQDEFRLKSKIHSLDKYKMIASLQIASDSTLSEEEQTSEIQKVEAQVAALKTSATKELEALEDSRTKDEKTSDKEITATIKLNNKDSVAGQYADMLADYKAATEQINKYQKRNNYLTTPKGLRDINEKKARNTIQQAQSLEELEDINKALSQTGMDMSKEYEARKDELNEIHKKEVNEVAEKIADEIEISGDNVETTVKNIIKDNPEEVINEVENIIKTRETKNPVKNNSTPTPLEPTDDTPQDLGDETGVDVNDKANRPYMAIPPDGKNENLTDWLETPTDKTKYKPIFKYEPNNGFEAITVKFVDENGEWVTHNGEIVKGYLYEKGIKDENGVHAPLSEWYQDFRNKIINAGVPVKGEITGQLRLPFTHTLEEYNIYETFGENPEFIYIDEAGYFTNLKGTKRKIDKNIKPSKQKAGQVYTVVRDNTGTEVPVKLNTTKLNDEQAEIVYQIYKEILESKDAKILNKPVSDNILALLNDKAEVYRKDGKHVTYKVLLSHFVYDSPSTHDYPANRLYLYKGSVRFGYTGEISNDSQIDKKLPFNVLNSNNVEDFATKEAFIEFIKTKRHNIKVKRLNEQEYRDYLVSNKFLNTDKPKGEVFKRPTQKGENGNKGSTGTLFFNPNKLEKKSVVKPTQQSSDIEAKKAVIVKIESERQSELTDIKNFIKLTEKNSDEYLNDNLAYRSIGEEGYLDAINSKTLRQKGKKDNKEKYSSVYFGNGIKGFEVVAEFAEKVSGNSFIAVVPRSNLKEAGLKGNASTTNSNTINSVSTKGVHYILADNNSQELYLITEENVNKINAKYDAKIAEELAKKPKPKVSRLEVLKEIGKQKRENPDFDADAALDALTPDDKMAIFAEFSNQPQMDESEFELGESVFDEAIKDKSEKMTAPKTNVLDKYKKANNEVSETKEPSDSSPLAMFKLPNIEENKDVKKDCNQNTPNKKK